MYLCICCVKTLAFFVLHTLSLALQKYNAISAMLNIEHKNSVCLHKGHAQAQAIKAPVETRLVYYDKHLISVVKR